MTNCQYPERSDGIKFRYVEKEDRLISSSYLIRSLSLAVLTPLATTKLNPIIK